MSIWVYSLIVELGVGGVVKFYNFPTDLCMGDAL